MEKHTGYGLQGAARAFLRQLSTSIVFLWLLPISALLLWSALSGHSAIAERLILTLFPIAFGWLSLSIWRWHRGCVGWEGSADRLLFGPRPEDPDELLVWKRGRHLRFSFLAVALLMAALPIMKWLQGDY